MDSREKADNEESVVPMAVDTVNGESVPADTVDGHVKFRRQVTPTWTQEKADHLQESVDMIFGSAGKTLMGLDFSFTIADPFLDGCPLIGCSTGFTKLCGYDFENIVGRNCRFLIDPVPGEKIDARMREHTRNYCSAVKSGREYWVPQSEHEEWMPSDRPGDELLCMQVNARKDGSLFNNMFFLKTFRLGADLGEEHPYIVGLQSELAGKEALAELGRNLTDLDANMEKVKAKLAQNFFVECSMSRQGPVDDD